MINIWTFFFPLKPKAVTYVVYFDYNESWNHKDKKLHFIDQKFEKFEILSNNGINILQHFLKRMSKMALLGPQEYPKKQSHEFWCLYSKIYGNGGLF